MNKQQSIEAILDHIVKSDYLVSYTELTDLTGKSLNTVKKYLKLLPEDLEFTILDGRSIRYQNEESLEDVKEISNREFKASVNSLAISNMIPAPFGEEVTDLAFSTDERNTYELVERCVLNAIKVEPKLSARDLEIAQSILDSVFERSTEKVEIPEDDLNIIKDLFLEVLNGKQALPSQIQVVYKSYLCAIGYCSYPNFAVIQAIAGASKTTCMKVLCSFIKLKTNHYPPLLAATHSATIGFQNGKTIQRFINDKLNLNIVDCTKDGGARSATSFVSLCRKRIASNTLSKAKFIIVEEYSQISDFYIAILSELAERVLFVGDFGQARRISRIPGKVIGTLSNSFRFKGNSDFADEVTNLRFLNSPSKMKEFIRSSSSYEFSGVLIPKHTKSKKGSYVDVVTKISYVQAFKDPILLAVLKDFTDFDSQIIAYSTAAVDAINAALAESVDKNGKAEIKAGSKVYLKDMIPEYPSVRQGTLWLVEMVLEDGKCFIVNPKTHESYIVRPSLLEVAYAISTIKAQGKEWDRVVAITGTSDKKSYLEDCYVLGTRGVEETVVFYRKDVDTSLVASTELLSASHDLSVTDSVHSMITQSVFTLCNHTLNRLKRNPSELSNMLSFAIGMFIANGDITDKKLRKAMRDKTPQIIAPEIDLKDPSWGYVYLPTDSGKRFRPCSTLKEAYTGVKFHSKKGQESYLYQDLQNSNTIVIDTDDEVSTNIMLQLFEGKTEIWLNEDKTSAHFVFGADLLYPSFSSGHEHCALPIDILGNQKPQKRFLKPNKKLISQVSPMLMTQDLFNDILSLRTKGKTL